MFGKQLNEVNRGKMESLMKHESIGILEAYNLKLRKSLN